MGKEPIKEYSVNSAAEGLLNVFLTIHVIIGWIFAIAALAVSIYFAQEMVMPALIIVGAVAALLILFIFYFGWAMYKLFINISRNLFNINERIKSIDEGLNREE